MKLGVFSISLSVKDISTSKIFYEKLGFEVFGGALEQNYLIMKNDNTLIGLFQDMFKNTILTFNPGWDANANTLETYDDVRVIQEKLLKEGLVLENKVDKNSEGPGSIVLKDPDGNTILIDQHI
ncbi:VOC family protein [Aureibaculum marinum]|uniref:VOC family protein n=1 Tax=Aureibaculum marinum TaxID=2487930 RepID=A0A3N4NN47_9FLAO|nr:VOC family protein [Aureibaculum marinum]RPD92999.1 VOC family protein [Aureibaculum marinum]